MDISIRVEGAEELIAKLTKLEQMTLKFAQNVARPSSGRTG